MADTIDFKAILDEALNLKDAANVPVSVSVYLDELAPEDLAACVRNAFASAASHARITLSYLGSAQAVPNSSDDLAVIVAGLDRSVGKLASDLRQAGVPTMVATSMPDYVNGLAREEGYPIPEGDVIAPIEASRADSPASRLVIGRLQEKASVEEETSEPMEADAQAGESDNSATVEEAVLVDEDFEEQLHEDVVAAPASNQSAGRGVSKLFVSLVDAAQKRVAAVQEAAASAAAQAQAEQQPVKTVAERISEAMPEGSDEPYELTEDRMSLLRERMGQWIISTCREKRLPLALAFPFVRRPLSTEFINMTSVQNAGIGAVLFIPGADMPIMTANQAKMLLQIAAAYGQPMTAERVKELAAVVAGGFACRTAARELVGLVPVGGFIVKAGIAYTATQAMGHAAVEYFEAGGGAVGLAGVVGKAKDVALGVVSAAQQAAGQQAEPEIDERTSAQKAADTAKEWGSRFSKAASTASAAAVPLASTILKSGVTSFVSGAGSMASSVKR